LCRSLQTTAVHALIEAEALREVQPPLLLVQVVVAGYLYKSPYLRTLMQTAVALAHL
jgi:hypothetical protein